MGPTPDEPAEQPRVKHTVAFAKTPIGADTPATAGLPANSGSRISFKSALNVNDAGPESCG